MGLTCSQRYSRLTRDEMEDGIADSSLHAKSSLFFYRQHMTINGIGSGRGEGGIQGENVDINKIVHRRTSTTTVREVLLILLS